MTAHPDRRRRRTIIGAVVAAVLSAAAIVLTVVGTFAVANSTEGEVIAPDDRAVAALPATDNAALAVVDAENRLTSLVIATVLPSGRGGSVVTVPIAADVNGGFGEETLALSSLLDVEDPDGFFQQVEETLAITLQFGEIVGPDRLAELLGPVLPFDVVLPSPLVESGAEAGDDAADGRRRVDDAAVEEVFLASNAAVDERRRHSIDVAVWSAAADAAGRADVTAPDLPVDDLGRPLTATTIDELVERLWSGPVQARDIQVVASVPADDGSTVVLDRADVVLVFAQVSPARVSTPLPGPVFRLVVPFSDGQVEAAGSEFESRRDIARTVIGEMLSVEVNVASVDAAPSPDGAQATTRIEVSGATFVDAVEDFWPSVLGEIDVVVADTLIDGVDVVVYLGTGYFEVDRSGAGAATDEDAATVDADG